MLSFRSTLGLASLIPKGGGSNIIMKYNLGTIVPGFSYAPPLAQTRECLDSLWGIKKPRLVGVVLHFILQRGRDSNPRYGFPYTHFPGVLLQPLGHLSVSYDLFQSGVQIYAFLPYFPNISSAR